jgi:tight adherence protein B
MLVPFAVFLGVVAIVVGAYFLLVVKEEERVLDRLNPKKTSKAGSLVKGGVIKEEERLSSMGPMQRLLEETTPLTIPLKQLIEQSGVQMNVGSFVLMSAVFGLGGYLAGVTVTNYILVGLFTGVLFGLLPLMYVRRARSKRMIKFEEHFPEAIDLIARALRAGHALPTGLGMAAEEAPKPVGPEFRKLYDEQNFGLALPDAMRNFARRVPVLDARFFVTAVLTQRETGGNLAEVLDNLSSVIRDRFKVKRQVRVISAHGRITGWILSALPPCLAFATLFLNPNHLGTLLGDELGVRMLITAGILQVIGTLIIRKIVDIEY